MLSHCCASCGTPLGADSRRFVRAVRMWVATCPGCGFAVRWCPNRARETVRTWNRLRALNNRLGIALGLAQLAAILTAVIGGILVDQVSLLREISAGVATLRSSQLFGFVILESCCAALVAGSAVAIAPDRSLVVRWFTAWTVGVAPVTLAILSLPVFFENASTMRKLAPLANPEVLPIVLVACAAPVVASLPLAAALSLLHRIVARQFARRFRRHITQTATIG